MKICIISDLHCKYQLNITTQSETLLFSNMPRKPYSQHPVVSMLKTIENDESIKSDVLLCAGDIGDKADEQGIASGWTFIEEIRQKLESQIKIGIPGNHDVNSRRINGKDAFTYIKNFHEEFPTNNDDLNMKFWGNGFCIQVFNESMFLLINTVYDHENEINANSSNLKAGLISEIEREIKAINNETIKYKICILHHHPIKHSNISNWKDSDSLEKGDDLLNMLNINNFSIVIHGHKHQPRLCEYNGLLIFATGSFSSFANLQGTNISPMFHIIEFENSNNKGSISSWEYNVRDGWTKNLNKYFPPKIGFGGNVDIYETAKSINFLLRKDNQPKLYTDILYEIPELAYIIPEKLIKLGEILKSEFNLTVSPEYPLQPSVVTIIK